MTMTMRLTDMAERLQERADWVERKGNKLWVVATGRRTAADLIALVKAHGFHTGRVEPVITGNDAEEVFSFLVLPYRLFTAADLRRLSGFPEGGYLAGIPYAALPGERWSILAQPENSPYFVLFRSQSPYTWRLHGTKPVGTGLDPTPYVVLDPQEADIRERIREFLAGSE